VKAIVFGGAGFVGSHVADALAAAGHEVVYNFAGLADIDEALSLPLETVGLNVLGCATLLDGARRAGVKRFVFASTIYV